MTLWNKFGKVYHTTCSLLDELGIPFGADPDCTVYLDDRWFSPTNLCGFSCYSDGEILLCREHLSQTLQEAQATLVHEITHYWCDVFPQVMHKGHTFRVPRVPWLVPIPDGVKHMLKTSLHTWLYDADDERFLGTYSQTRAEECLADFMADLIVYQPDLRRVRSQHARRRYQACRRMLSGLRLAYRAT